MYKLTTDTLSKNLILFINNYFIELKIITKLITLGIIICGTMKSNRIDLSELLMKMKQQFVKDIPYDVLAVMIQNDILIIVW